jgi:Trypsin-like peptidase domain
MARTRIEQTVVGVLESLNGEQGKPIGTGFLIATDRVVTAYHVVQDALGLDKNKTANSLQPIWLTFPQASGSRRRAFLIPERSGFEEDIATLYVKNIPLAAKIMPLSGSYDAGHPFVSMGYRAPAGAAFGYISGMEIRADNLPPRIILTSDQISYGMSGAPVVDLASHRAVGMVLSVWNSKSNQLRRDVTTNFALSAARIHYWNSDVATPVEFNIPPELLLPLIAAIELSKPVSKIWQECKKVYKDIHDHWKHKYGENVEERFDEDALDFDTMDTDAHDDFFMDADDDDPFDDSF